MNWNAILMFVLGAVACWAIMYPMLAMAQRDAKLSARRYNTLRNLFTPTTYAVKNDGDNDGPTYIRRQYQCVGTLDAQIGTNSSETFPSFDQMVDSIAFRADLDDLHM